MSIISNRHTVNRFVAGKSDALTGQRLSKVGYKSTKKTRAKYPSICVSVPKIQAPISSEYLTRLQPYIVTMIQTAQDGIIKSLYESSDGNLGTVSDDDISMGAVCAYLESEASGGRLTIEIINTWFDEQMKDNLFVVVADRLKFDLSTPEQESTVNKHVAGYREMFSALSGGKTFYSPAQIAGLKRALEVSSVEDDMSEKLLKRLEAMEGKKDVELMVL